jgi:predicted enzyme related to lactoylglutathione lyase
MGQPVAMFEIISNDHERVSKFYAELFGWTIDTNPAWGGYGLVDTTSDPASVPGGIGPSMAPGDTGVKIYVRVDDLDAGLARAAELGGTRLVEPTELPDGYGRFAMFADPDGNPVGLWA